VEADRAISLISLLFTVWGLYLAKREGHFPNFKKNLLIYTSGF
jgi:hypothetical protein